MNTKVDAFINHFISTLKTHQKVVYLNLEMWLMYLCSFLDPCVHNVKVPNPALRFSEFWLVHMWFFGNPHHHNSKVASKIWVSGENLGLHPKHKGPIKSALSIHPFSCLSLCSQFFSEMDHQIFLNFWINIKFYKSQKLIKS